jgi:hypothetical protein
MQRGRPIDKRSRPRIDVRTVKEVGMSRHRRNVEDDNNNGGGDDDDVEG